MIHWIIGPSITYIHWIKSIVAPTITLSPSIFALAQMNFLSAPAKANSAYVYAQKDDNIFVIFLKAATRIIVLADPELPELHGKVK